MKTISQPVPKNLFPAVLLMVGLLFAVFSVAFPIASTQILWVKMNLWSIGLTDFDSEFIPRWGWAGIFTILLIVILVLDILHALKIIHIPAFVQKESDLITYCGGLQLVIVAVIYLIGDSNDMWAIMDYGFGFFAYIVSGICLILFSSFYHQ